MFCKAVSIWVIVILSQALDDALSMPEEYLAALKAVSAEDPRDYYAEHDLLHLYGAVPSKNDGDQLQDARENPQSKQQPGRTQRASDEEKKVEDSSAEANEPGEYYADHELLNYIMVTARSQINDILESQTIEPQKILPLEIPANKTAKGENHIGNYSVGQTIAVQNHVNSAKPEQPTTLPFGARVNVLNPNKKEGEGVALFFLVSNQTDEDPQTEKTPPLPFVRPESYLKLVREDAVLPQIPKFIVAKPEPPPKPSGPSSYNEYKEKLKYRGAKSFAMLFRPVADHLDEYHHPKYYFKYGVYDPYTGDKKYQYENRDGDEVTGVYAFVEPDGKIRTVNYKVKKDSGFNAHVLRVLKAD